MTLTLDEWLAREGYGAAHRLMFRAGVSHPTIQRARRGRASLASALKISFAVGGIVAVSSMTADEVPFAAAPPAPASTSRKRIKGARR